MKLITEHIESLEILKEDAPNGQKTWHVQGIVMQAEIRNRNGRLYPKDILQRECERYNKEYVSKNRAYGELGHPDTPKIQEERISHLITDLHPDGNNWIGKAKILDTNHGRIAKGILEGGGILAASSRALGSLREQNGSNIVQADLKLMTPFDLVVDPSASEALLRGIQEGVEWVFLNGQWTEINNQKAVEFIKESHNQEDYEARALRLMKSYFGRL